MFVVLLQLGVQGQFHLKQKQDASYHDIMYYFTCVI